MSGTKRAVAAAALLASAALAVGLYLNFHAFYRSKRDRLGPEEKIAALQPANRIWPVMDQTLAEEGKARLDLALEALPDTAEAERNLRRAENLLRRSLRLNPASAAGHLLYSRTLRYLNYLSAAGGPDSLPELWKAARLAGKRSPIDFDLCRELLENWPRLDETQRARALELVRDVLARENVEQFFSILQVWDLTVGDNALLEETLPDSARLLRAYADFLGGKSEALETRHRLLARAETLEYNRALREKDEGNPDACLRLLDGIRFYAALSETEGAEAEVLKHQVLRREALLDRAKARLLKSRRLEDAEADLRAYLELEDNYGRILELETFLREINILREESFIRPTVGDLRRLAFEVFLMFKLNKYSGITALGGAVQGGVIVLQEAQKPFLAEIFTLTADAYDKLNFIYEPEDLYRRALELQPRNGEIMFKLRRYYDRLNEKEKKAEVDRALDAVLTPEAVFVGDGVLPKGRARAFDMVLEPGPVRMTLQFENFEGGLTPLIAVHFRGRVIREDFFEEPELSLDVDAKAGRNRLEIIPVNRTVRLLGIRRERIGG
ncbi:MAG: hypothetical protein JW747_10005 [Candidatus Aminicenantes bacterium]|nr:hypothetical protein [Candidatus Aminicenantes bacterium]